MEASTHSTFSLNEKSTSVMEQRLSIITIGTDSLQTMRKFYVQKFGWQPVAENKDIIFFKLNGFLLGLYPRKNLAAFCKTKPNGSGFRPYTFAYMVDSKEKVIELYNQMKNNGIKIISKPATPPFGGSYFIIADIEGNIWEIAQNPFIVLDEIGNVNTHKPIN